MTSLWMGNLEPYMDENFITRAFATMGELVIGVRIIRNKINWGAAGYCFLELSDEETVERCLRKVNGRSIPGATPPRKFKLNPASYGKQREKRNRAGYIDNKYSQPYSYNENQHYQQYPDYFPNWDYDQSTGSYDRSDYSGQTHEEVVEDGGLEDPAEELDVAEANRLFIKQSEELYDALIDCHWPTLDSADPTTAQ